MLFKVFNLCGNVATPSHIMPHLLAPAWLIAEAHYAPDTQPDDVRGRRPVHHGLESRHLPCLLQARSLEIKSSSKILNELNDFTLELK